MSERKRQPSGSANRKAAKARALTEAARQKARTAGAADPGPGPNASCPECKRAFPHLQPDPWDAIAAPDLSRPELMLLWANRLAAVTLWRAVRDPYLTDEEKYRRVGDYLAKMGMVRDKVNTQGLVEELEGLRARAGDKSGGGEPLKPGSWKKRRAGAGSEAGTAGAGTADALPGHGPAGGAEKDG